MVADLKDVSLDAVKDRSYFVIRRVHSLLGLVPVGVFLCVHLTINATILMGPDKFGFAVDQIHVLERLGLLVPVEIAFIFLPLLFHAVLGVVIALSGSVNVGRYGYCGNLRYVLQRVTGFVAFAFVLAHLWHVHWLGKPMGGGVFVAHNSAMEYAAAISAAQALQSSWLWMVFYTVGVVASTFHLANGVWTAFITWGITVGPRSQKGFGFVCGAFGLGLALVGLGALCGFSRFDYEAAEDGKGEAVAHVVTHVEGDTR